MPSPFAKYQGEQVPQLNILPYTAKIAEDMGKGIASIGDIIGKYGAHQNYRKELTTTAAGIINQFMEEGEPTNDGKPTVPELSGIAPSHVKDLYKKALKENPDNWMDGLAGVSTSDINAFGTLHQKYEVDTQQKFDNSLKGRQMAATEAQVAIAKAADARAQELHADQKELVKAQTKAAKAAATIAETTAPDEIAKAAAQRKEIEERAKALENARLIEQQKIELSNTKVPTTRVDKVKGKPTMQGDLYLGGEKIDSGDVKTLTETFGIGIEDIEGSDEYKAARQAVDPKTWPQVASARFLAGDKEGTFNPYDKESVSPAHRQQFVEGLYNILEKNATTPESKQKLQRFFYAMDDKDNTSTLTGNTIQTGDFKIKGPDGKPVTKANRYEFALKMLDNPDVRKAVVDAGANLVPPNTDYSYYKIKPTGYSTTETEVTVPRTPSEIAVAKYEALSAKAKMVIDLPTWLKTQGIDMPSVSTINGQDFVKVGTESYVPISQFGAGASGGTKNGGVGTIGGKALSPSEQIKQVELNTSLRWAGKFEGKGVKVGNYTVSSKGTDALGFNYTDQKVRDEIDSSLKSLSFIDEIADKMSALTDKSFAEKLASPNWDIEYQQVQRFAETFRKTFMAPGPETEPDARRLAQVVAEQGVWLKANPKLAHKVIENFRNLVAGKVTSDLSNKNLAVSTTKKIGSIDKTQVAEIIAQARKSGAFKTDDWGATK